MESILLKDIIQKPISGEWGLEDLYGTGIPVLRTANFTNEGIINFENVVTRNISPPKLKGKLLQKGDILLEKSGGSDRQPVGRVVYFDGQADKYGFNNFTSALRISDLTMWNPKYIFYALYANYHHGGTRKYENKTTGLHNLKVDLFIRSFSVPYATLIKQNEIVKKLDLLNHLENVCEVQLQKLDELIKSRFLEMFGNKEYSICQLSDQCEIITKGTTPTTIGYNFTTDGVRFIKIENITEEGKFDTAKMMHISDECNMIMKRSQLKSGDLLFSIAGAIGRCAVVTNDILPANINQALAIIRLRKDAQLSRNFLFAVLKSSYVEKQYKGLRRGGAQLNLSLKDIGNFKILLPPESEQENFIDLYKQVDKSKMAVQKSLDELETLKKSLMQTYFG